MNPRTQITVFAEAQDREPVHGGEPLDRSAVRELAAFSGHPAVTSLYIDVDGRDRPLAAECDAALEGLFRQARHQAARLQPSAAESVEADLEAIRGWIAEGLDRSWIRGLSLFSCAAAGWWHAVTLAVPVRDQVSVGPHPDVTQLEELLARPHSLVVTLVDRQEARLLRADPAGLVHLAAIVDPVERQADNDVEVGGWQHRHDEADRRHLRRVATALADASAGHPDDRLVLSGSTRTVGELVKLLPAPLTERLVGRLSLPVHSSDGQLKQELSGLWSRLEEQRRGQLVELVRSGLATGRAVSGLEDALTALNEKRAETLVLSRGYAASGARCPSCGHLGAAARPCPWCSTLQESADNVVDEAVQLALAQDATVEVVPADAMADLGPIAVLERYR